MPSSRCFVPFLLAAIMAVSPAQEPVASAGERWIVHLGSRSFDLQALESAIATRRPAAEIRELIAGYERAVRADQEPLARAVAELGGRVRAQWWIINACAVELSQEAASTLSGRDDLGVVRLEQDGASRAGSERAKDRYNHNSAALHASGLTGAGVTIAIVDTGQDELMDNSGRPHRVYYPLGDPSNTTGNGMGGSRLLFNRQIGAMPAGAVAWHGTSVTAIAAGGDWGTPGAGHGHAYGSDIAAYAIADLPDTTSWFSTQITAWQQVLADRATHNIEVANFSYHGQPDPTAATQQAIDVAASVGDMLIATIAGNFGNGGTTNSNGATNVLAAAAARADWHDVLDYSSRGPMSGDPLRTFPDLAAVVHSYVPVPDCELGDTVFSGSSNAAPHVSGVAALIRAAHPSLSALQTRALLLASTYDLRARVPGQGVNDRGVGLLRADTAEAAATAGFVAAGQVDPANPAWTWSFPVTQGSRYALALAWNRNDPTSSAWSDLDLRVHDGSSVVASSTSPRNTYEVARFTATATGNWQVRVDGLQFPQGQQDFAVALAEQPARVPLAGQLQAYSQGCAGSAGMPSQILSGVNANLTADHLLPGEDWGNYDMAVLVPVSGGRTVTGFELLLASDDPRTVNTEVYAVGPGGRPAGPPLATGTVDLDRVAAWYRTTLPPFTAPGPSLWVVLDFSQPARLRTWLSSSVATRIAWRSPCGGWTTPMSAAVGVRLLGPGSLGDTPLLSAGPRPTLGTRWNMTLQRALPSTAVFTVLGISNRSHQGRALPIGLGPLGAPGCKILAAPASVVGGSTDGAGGLILPLAVPSGTAFLAMDLYVQTIVLDPAANSLGIAVSQGIRARLGSP